jgi:nucleotide-binding universal stress UspA family protein
MQLRTILVPTDFSAHADRALDLAREIAARSGAALELVHSFHVPPEAVAYLTAASLQRMQTGARTELELRCKRARAAGLTCEARWLEAPPASAISEQASKSHADLIVQGSHGHTGVRYALLGSVAARVARAAPCPVLTVKEAGPSGARLRTIAVAMDFSAPARRALAAARDLGRMFGPAHLVLVHAHYVPPEVAAILAEHGAHLPGADDPSIARQLEPLLVELQDAGISSEYVTEPGHPADVLQRIALRVNADLIALGTHGRRGLSRLLLGSVAEQVLRSAPTAVLTVGPPPART